MIRDWLHIFYNHLNLVDNSPSVSPNLEGFVENRYDQSIFSILCKLRGITPLDCSETYAEDWNQLAAFPFQDRRDMGLRPPGKGKWIKKIRNFFSCKSSGLGIRSQYKRLCLRWNRMMGLPRLAHEVPGSFRPFIL